MKKALLGIMLAAMVPMAGQAQRYIGIATSNWSGTNGLYLNPANIADSRHKFTIDILSFNVGAENNLASVKTSKVIDYFQDRDNTNLSDALDFGNTNKLDNFNLVLPYSEVRGPGFMASINRKHSIAVTTRVRAVSQFHDIDESLYRTITDSNFSNTFDNGFQQKADGFNWTTHAWAEVGATYGAVIYENTKHQVKGGVTARYLMGGAYMSFVNDNMDIQYYAGTDSVRITNSDMRFGSNATSTDDNIAEAVLKGISDNPGSGFGLDLGVVYEFRPNHKNYKYDMDGETDIPDLSHNQYLLRASVAVTDIGHVNYTNGNKTVNFTGNGYVTGRGLADAAGSYTSMKSYLEQQGFAADSSTGAKSTVTLPTTLIIGLDYNIGSNFYANLMYTQNLVNRENFGNSFYNNITITPRYDVRQFSVSMPVTYSMLSQRMHLGVGLRAGGFIIGSDDIISFGGKYGANVYMGGYIPINKKKPKDNDGDLVSNAKDKCKNEKGVWEMQGCPNPDKDGDGVLDKDDMCPDVFGSKTAKGCPDADLDSVADASDRCPQEYGPVVLQGCPDRDNDGVADIDDLCPDQPGLAQFKGCADTDNDGVPDNEDLCPQLVGPIANKGCPDTDNDGVPDNIDKCPTVAGTVANQGCPEVTEEVKKRLAFAATAIQFDLGKATIKKTSHKTLDDIVKILNEYPDYMMTIDGHTDNTGSAATNLRISKERANAVKKYFTSKGIAADRLVAEGYGDTKPVTSNKTAAGRAKNRRVAMDLKLKN